MDFRQLRYFVAVADLQHVGRAAEQLNIAQPALSQHIQRLEAQIGVPLFSREKRRLTLTSAGILFLQQARLALEQADYAVQVVKRADRGEVGQVKVDYVGSAMLGPTTRRLLCDFKRTHADVELVLRERNVMDQVTDLGDESGDAGVVRGPLPFLSSKFGCDLIEREELVVCLPADHRHAAKQSIAIGDLRDDMFVMPMDPPGVGLTGQVGLLGQAAGFMPRIVQHAAQTTTVVCLVASGFGVSILPASLSQLRLKDVVFRQLEGDAVTSLYLLYRADNRRPVVSAFLRSCRATLANSVSEEAA